jgi:hypothetical protein
MNEIIDLDTTNLYWTTLEGNRIPVRYLSNSHLGNIITHLAKRITQLSDYYNLYYYNETVIYNIESMLFRSMWWIELMRNLATYRIENDIHITEEGNAYYQVTNYEFGTDTTDNWYN